MKCYYTILKDSQANIMPTQFLNDKLISKLSLESFKLEKSSSWFNFQNLISPVKFHELLNNFPPINLFEEHKNLRRRYGQRPHNRYYLAYDSSIHHSSTYEGKGIIRHSELPTCWQKFIGELASTQYTEFIQSILNINTFSLRFDWHIGINGSEVSPHLDAPVKVATHLFYFNTDEDWNYSWGGETLILGDKLTNYMNPSFDDFRTTKIIKITDNSSLLLQNSPEAWHGVKPLSCPQNRCRKLFNVVFETPHADAQPLLFRAGLQED